MAATRKSSVKKPAKPAAAVKAPPAAPSPAPAAIKSSSNPTVKAVHELAEILKAYGLAEISVDLRRATVTLRAAGAAAAEVPRIVSAPAAPAGPLGIGPSAIGLAPEPAAPASAAPPPAAVDDGKGTVKSPFVGTFYRSPSPDADAFVEVGDRVAKGQVLCIVEAMKLMNEIEAERAGVVQAILVENGQPVEYGQPLFKLGD